MTQNNYSYEAPEEITLLDMLFLVPRTEIKLGCVIFERNCSLNKRSITDLLPQKPFSPVQEVPFILLNYIISNETQISNKLKLTFSTQVKTILNQITSNKITCLK